MKKRFGVTLLLLVLLLNLAACNTGKTEQNEQTGSEQEAAQYPSFAYDVNDNPYNLSACDSKYNYYVALNSQKTKLAIYKVNQVNNNTQLLIEETFLSSSLVLYNNYIYYVAQYSRPSEDTIIMGLYRISKNGQGKKLLLKGDITVASHLFVSDEKLFIGSPEYIGYKAYITYNLKDNKKTYSSTEPPENFKLAIWDNYSRNFEEDMHPYCDKEKFQMAANDKIFYCNAIDPGVTSDRSLVDVPSPSCEAYEIYTCDRNGENRRKAYTIEKKNNKELRSLKLLNYDNENLYYYMDYTVYQLKLSNLKLYQYKVKGLSNADKAELRSSLSIDVMQDKILIYYHDLKQIEQKKG